MSNSAYILPIAISAIAPNPQQIPVEFRIVEWDKRYLSSTSMPANVDPVVVDNSEKILTSIGKLAELKGNWDGYGAESLSPKAIQNSILFIEGLKNVIEEFDEDSVVATPYGTIVMDFRNGNEFISVEIGDNRIAYFSELSDNNPSSDGVPFNSYSLPEDLLANLKILYSKTI